MIYAAIALSLVLIWRGTRILNYAQGGMAMFTTYIALIVISHTGSYWAGFAAPSPPAWCSARCCEQTVVRPVENKPPLNAVIVTIGLLILLEGLAGIIYGGQYRSFPAAFSIKGLRIGGTAWASRRNDVFVAGRRAGRRAGPGPDVPLHLGRPAAAGDGVRPGVARLLGVRIGRVLTLGWALAGLIGALAGVLVTPVHVPLPEQHGLDLRAGLHRRGDRRPGQPGRRGRRRPRPRRRAQLRRRLPRSATWCRCSAWPPWSLVLMIRPSGLFSGATDPAGVTMTLAPPPGRGDRAGRASRLLSVTAERVPRLPDRRGRRVTWSRSPGSPC